MLLTLIQTVPLHTHHQEQDLGLEYFAIAK